MIIRIVSFESALSEEEVIAVAKERADQFRALPGLLQKYYVKLRKPSHYGGVYIWDSEESMSAYQESELAASIAAAYKTVGAPTVQVLDTLFQLRE
ncbi:MAG: YdhR family protein [Gammaproteobacteria bacterium]